MDHCVEAARNASTRITNPGPGSSFWSVLMGSHESRLDEMEIQLLQPLTARVFQMSTLCLVLIHRL